MSIPSKKKLLSKKDRLAEIKHTLKQEFFGIDDIIDEIIDSMSSWYLVPSMQNRPLVVNLWGMTGVGKTAVIKRIAELVHFQEHFFKFDMGEIGASGLKMRWQFEDMAKVIDKKPFIICLDEFQFARTIDKHGNNLDKRSSRIVWEILDDGEVNLNTSRNLSVQQITDLCEILKHILKQDLEVEAGRVVSGMKLYQKYMERAQFEINNQNPSGLWFVPKRCYPDILDVGRQDFSSVLDVERELNRLGGRETIELLEKLIEQSHSQRKLDCTKAIVFIIGNLDEAFSMSREINPDLSTDRTYENSKKINVSNIKQTLGTYFRPEQVARLGNHHLIYPALNKKVYKKIIDHEFEKINKQFVNKTGVPIVFHSSVKKIIYAEGVYPSLGTRPLFSTISNCITSKLGLVVSDLITNNQSFNLILLTYQNDYLIFEFYDSNKQCLNCRKFFFEGCLSRLRKPKRNDEQAVSAVHESGHAILAISLMGVIPSLVRSVSAEASNNGFTYLSMESEIFCKKDMIARAAMALGGYLAEKLVFGEGYVHTGSSDDLQKITQIVSKLVKSEGMGSELLSVNIASPDTNFSYHDNKGRLNEEVRKVMNQAEELAEQTLKNEMNKLLILADHLSDNAKIDQEGIIGLLGIEKPGKKLFYRKNLKERVEEMITEKKNVA